MEFQAAWNKASSSWHPTRSSSSNKLVTVKLKPVKLRVKCRDRFRLLSSSLHCPTAADLCLSVRRRGGWGEAGEGWVVRRKKPVWLLSFKLDIRARWKWSLVFLFPSNILPVLRSWFPLPGFLGIQWAAAANPPRERTTESTLWNLKVWASDPLGPHGASLLSITEVSFQENVHLCCLKDCPHPFPGEHWQTTTAKTEEIWIMPSHTSLCISTGIRNIPSL